MRLVGVGGAAHPAAPADAAPLRDGATCSKELPLDGEGVVVRGHIWVENELIRYIECRTADLKALKRLKLDYDGRIDMALVLGLDSSLKAALSALGALRNQFAHTLRATISKSDADNFRNCFSSEIRKTLDREQRSAVDTILKDSPDGNIKPGLALPKLRWIMHVIGLWAALVADNAEARDVGSER